MPIDLRQISSGYDLSSINYNFQLLESKFDEKLDRFTSEQGNQMNQDFDMNGYNILNAKISGVDIEALANNLSNFSEQAQQARDEALQYSQDALGYTSQAEGFKDSAELAADQAEQFYNLFQSINSSPVTEWEQGETTTNPLQRYLFENNLYIAPTASDANPITLEATPVGDNNWVPYATPVRVFSYEEVVTSDTNTITVGTSFLDVVEVFVNGLVQESGSITALPTLKQIQLDETVPAGTHVKVWLERSKDAILNDYLSLLSNVNVAIAENEVFKDGFGEFNEEVSGSSTDVYRPGAPFTNVDLKIEGVAQSPSSYTIEVDSNNSSYNQIRFSEVLPIGTKFWGEYRDNS